MKNGLNWKVMVLVQYAYPNRKPSEKNTHREEWQYAGMTRDRVEEDLRHHMAYYDKTEGKVIEHGEIIEREVTAPYGRY